MKLRYHQKTFELLNQEARFSQEFHAKIESIKREKGIAIPSSVVEWYSLENATEILRQNSNDDHFLEVEDFGKPSYKNEDLLAERLLLFMIENQGVCEWAIKLDNSDDPPVFAKDVDSKIWEFCAEKFSTFIWTLVFDWGRIRQNDSYFLCAQAEPITQNDLSELQRNFQEEPRTHCFPGKINYRFSQQDKRILIWSNSDQADWNISTNSPQALYELAQGIWHLSNLKISLYDIDENGIGKSILNELRRES